MQLSFDTELSYLIWMRNVQLNMIGNKPNLNLRN